MTTAKSGAAGRVLVIGGYGAVGSKVTSTLADWFPGRVVPAGRDEARARQHGGVRVDIGDLDGVRRVLDELGDVGVVALCVEPEDAGLARICLERGIHLVDVGATHELIEDVTDLDELALQAGATAVLSVGVAPGLTNLLARRVNGAVGGAERIDLTVLLGAGERHGTDAVRWTVAGLGKPVTAGSRRLPLAGFGVRTAHAFPFSDQYTLRRTLGVSDVTTRLCLDSRPLTAALFALRGTGLLGGVHGARPQRLLTSAFSRVHIGGDGFVVRADAYSGDREATLSLTGQGQSRATGLVAAHVIRALLTQDVPVGVHHLEQLTALADLPEQLAAHGITAAR
ncbi:saccharopine dehydrogenase NADP-binding domain-containing protein [Streptomyces katrae]|uniref:Saccharopine dehydrogenase NADP-binding domain-containing protein n=1 Tax=Streptomyces katrae TaxID=68223 RepID=A0ABT7GLJ8_9ACTN|nr:saccharopine dehydrogenase NADP-binding domain-containing protein [Streptomyces katrae]MDK9494448.1 saccharopine dehydrogenase NADP-binding domain-containing protein [Streptomyces katrae]